MKKTLLLALLVTVNTQCSTTHHAGKEIAEQVKKLRKNKNPEDCTKIQSAQVDGEMPHLSAIAQKAVKTLGLEEFVSDDSFIISTSLSDNVWIKRQGAKQPALLRIPYGAAGYSDAVLTAIIGRAIKLFVLQKKHRLRKTLAALLAYAGPAGLGFLTIHLADKKRWWPEWAVRTNRRANLSGAIAALPFAGAGIGVAQIASRFYSRELEKAADKAAFKYWAEEMEHYLEKQQAETKLLAKELKQRMKEKPSKKMADRLKQIKKHPSYKQAAGLMDHKPTHDERLEHLLEHTGQI